MSRTIKCTESDFKTLTEQLNNLDKAAGDYCPQKEDVVKILEQKAPYDLAYYIRFFLWIVLTGTTTEENMDNREFLSGIIAKNIQIIKAKKEEAEI